MHSIEYIIFFYEHIKVQFRIDNILSRFKRDIIFREAYKLVATVVAVAVAMYDTYAFQVRITFHKVVHSIGFFEKKLANLVHYFFFYYTTTFFSTVLT